MTRVIYNRQSGNKKVGPIPTATVQKSTCPGSCPLKENGCYANSGMTRFRWDEVAAKGISWDKFCDEIRALPAGTLWRYAIAGDLPGEGEDIDVDELMALINANVGKNGFTFTHKPLNQRNSVSIGIAISNGFTINISAWDAADADAKLAADVAPVVCMIPWGTPALSETPGGVPVVACLAQVYDDKTCQNCGLCSKASRKFVIGFYPHGPGRANGGRNVNERLLG